MQKHERAALGNAQARASSLDETGKVGLEPKHKIQYADLAMKNFDAIMTAYGPVVDGVDLPALGADELNLIAKRACKGGDSQPYRLPDMGHSDP
ncbi:hypothetical protein CNE_BB1p07360 (plasmid) [Cupriavidus necator N-1]|uniref:Uncharacterized protein n=1 Tax=Cupriavidus necator (strain ATCC 43291 / DSM 13513 / CCUG 52238 / LMG 8453 / N-1) TaxID=1042878 RepID=F8GXT3_CUPNN|nr:hypothetical protein [Cupriavidus necator]AEI82153.1 hypothetical protein CNE_BB1p07360 [Cupriavidus necator N-1]MDX6007181.1 hypothetical protein [Cupriavidus necator]